MSVGKPLHEGGDVGLKTFEAFLDGRDGVVGSVGAIAAAIVLDALHDGFRIGVQVDGLPDVDAGFDVAGLLRVAGESVEHEAGGLRVKGFKGGVE